jgi:outer membrane protein assembly factor BamB
VSFISQEIAGSDVRCASADKADFFMDAASSRKVVTAQRSFVSVRRIPELLAWTDLACLTKNHVMKSFLFAVLALACAVSARAENWPGFRGPTRQGISTETNLPLHWSSSSNVAWIASIPGEGWSSPVVWSNRVFLTSATEAGTKCHVIAIDVVTGKPVWNKQVIEQLPRRKEAKNSWATPTPVTDGERVFAVFGDGSMAALNFDGGVLWTNRDVKFYSRHGLGASPLLYENLLIMPYDGSNPVATAGQWPNNSDEERLGWQIPWDKAIIMARNAKTGSRVWFAKRGLSRIAHVSPIIVPVDGTNQLISGAGDRMQGFDLKTGKLIWSVYQQGEGVTPSPVASRDLLFTSSGFEKTTLRAIRLGGATGDVTQTHIAWEQKKGVPTQPSLLYVKPYLYAITDGGIATCYQEKTGDVVWQERVGGNFSASPVFADGRIYFLSEAAETTVIAPGPEFKVLAKNKLEGKCQASMAVSGGKFFIRTDKNLICIKN